MTYGLCETAAATREQGLLPIGLAEGCVLRNDLERGQVITYDDVEVPAGRLCDRLRSEQDEAFADERSIEALGRRTPVPPGRKIAAWCSSTCRGRVGRRSSGCLTASTDRACSTSRPSFSRSRR